MDAPNTVLMKQKVQHKFTHTSPYNERTNERKNEKKKMEMENGSYFSVSVQCVYVCIGLRMRLARNEIQINALF